MAAAPKSDYKRGSMDIREQQATFGLFWFMTKVGSIACIVLLVIMALTLT
jgi:hypothetical protein